jgi:hypothetical protein
MAKREVPMVGGEPDTRQKLRVRIFLAVFLGLQLVVPLRYYFGDDPYDERFSWRMFSAVRVHQCQISVIETVSDQPTALDLNREIHRAWVTTMSRNRDSVVKSFLAARCARQGVSDVRVTNNCVAPGGTRVDPIVWTRECRTGVVNEPEIVLDVGGDS